MNELHAQIISRQQAKEKCISHYFTGKPCAYGGVGVRRTSNGDCKCVNCLSIEAKRKLKYRALNSESVSAYKKSYNYKNRERDLRRSREYHLKNRESIIKKMRENCKITKKLRNANNAKRRANRIDRTLCYDNDLTEFVLQEAYAQADDLESLMGFKFHVDHMVPLQGKSVSGLHYWANLQVIPQWLNISKRNRLIYTEPFSWISNCL